MARIILVLLLFAALALAASAALTLLRNLARPATAAPPSRPSTEVTMPGTVRTISYVLLLALLLGLTSGWIGP